MPIIRIAVLAAGAALAVVGVRKVKRSRAAKRADGSMSGDAIDLTEPADLPSETYQPV